MKMFVISVQFNFLLRTFCVSGAKKIVMMNKRIFIFIFFQCFSKVIFQLFQVGRVSATLVTPS